VIDTIVTWMTYLWTLLSDYVFIVATHVVWWLLSALFLVVWHSCFEARRPTPDEALRYCWRAILLGLLPATYTARLVEVSDFAIISYIAISLIVLLLGIPRKPTGVSPGG